MHQPSEDYPLSTPKGQEGGESGWQGSTQHPQNAIPAPNHKKIWSLPPNSTAAEATASCCSDKGVPLTRGGGGVTVQQVPHSVNVSLNAGTSPFIPNRNHAEPSAAQSFAWGGGGGAVGGTRPPSGDPELLEEPKKFFGLNRAPEKTFRWPKTRRKICPIT